MEGRSVSENPLALPRPDRDPLESLGINTNKSWQQISIMEPGTVRTLGRDQFIMFTENRPGEHIHAYRQP
jgi:hypothetical protein